MKGKLNIRNSERIIANVRHLAYLFSLFIEFRKSFKNSVDVFKAYLFNYDTVKVILDNKKINLSPRFCYSIAMLNQNNVKLDFKNDVVSLKSSQNGKENEIIFHGGVGNGDIYNVFLKNDYEKLIVKDKVVLDIGANIGDSSIYFALNGAKKVIALEPFPMNQKMALRNIEKNNLNEKCEINLAGCGKSKNVLLTKDFKSDVDSVLQNQNTGEKIPIYTLEQIVEKFQIPDNSILKIDCEGCEYEAILNAPKSILKKFDQILVEYHNGYLDLKEKIEDSGFAINMTGPESTGFIGKYLKKIKGKEEKTNIKENSTSKRPFGYVGLIFAKQIEKI